MKKVALAAFCLLLSGCAGTITSSTQFAGTYQGTWTSLSDATDAGTSLWTVDASGNVTGQDFDPGRATTFDVVGHIDPAGHLATHSTPTGGTAATLDGSMVLDNAGHLSGVLKWGVASPLFYQYTFTRNPIR